MVCNKTTHHLCNYVSMHMKTSRIFHGIYPAPIKMAYVELPASFETKHGDCKSNVLKLQYDLYGEKQARQLLNDSLSRNSLFMVLNNQE